ncbi:MAG: hypothetical protein PHF37_06455 [Phycisphaerae bacterium]|nr:hypothetical protein [Phycisphaerae bacterium]
MAISDTIKESLANIPADLQRTAQSAFADIQNTYQAFLVRDTSYAGLHSSNLSHDIATQEAVKDAPEPESPQPTQDLEPER